MNNIELQKNRHALYRLQYYLVVPTKYRKPCINEKLKKETESIFKRIIKSNSGDLLEFTGNADYIIVKFEIPPCVELAKLVNNLKTVSSRLIRKENSNYLNSFYDERVFWSRSYCILIADESAKSLIKDYLNSQAGLLD